MLMEMKNTLMDVNRMENQSIQSFRSLISDTNNPVFIVETGSGLIFAANEAAVNSCGSYNPAGELFTDIVHFESDRGPVFFDGRWLEFSEEPVRWNHKTYTKIMLKQPSSVPDDMTLSTIRNMIAVLLHRLRSPMTGMQGYLEMIEHVDSETDKRKLSKVGEGLDYLFEIMDELELLHHADTAAAEENSVQDTRAEQVIREILFSYEPELRNRISVVNHTTENFKFNATELKQIMTPLINNATEHTSGKNSPIRIEIVSPRQIDIQNGGDPIPDSVADNLYFPFVTTKANNLGIGLSLAHLIASRRQAAILLKENSAVKGIRFSLLCSPVAN